VEKLHLYHVNDTDK